MLDLLAKRKRILYIDESTIPSCDYRHQKWGVRGEKNTVAEKDLTEKVNMIAGLCTDGQVYAALTQENTDSDVFVTFLSKLVVILHKEQPEFRTNLVIVLDGARYHTSQNTRLVLKRLGLSYVISAPYAYDAAPIELLFGYFKKVRIMPDGEKIGRR